MDEWMILHVVVIVAAAARTVCWLTFVVSFSCRCQSVTFTSRTWMVLCSNMPSFYTRDTASASSSSASPMNVEAKVLMLRGSMIGGKQFISGLKRLSESLEQ